MIKQRTVKRVSEFIEELGHEITEIEYSAGNHVIHFDTQYMAAWYYNTRKPDITVHIDYKGFIEFVHEDDSTPTWIVIQDRLGVPIISMSPSSTVSLNRKYEYFKLAEQEAEGKSEELV